VYAPLLASFLPLENPFLATHEWDCLCGRWVGGNTKRCGTCRMWQQRGQKATKLLPSSAIFGSSLGGSFLKQFIMPESE